MSNKTHWKKAFNKDYLGAHDLDEGQELKLTIKNVIVKEVTDPQGTKTSCDVAYFTDKKVKPMILNVGACKIIKRFTNSNYIEDWAGTTVQVYVMENVKAFGETTDALRLREYQPRMEKEELTPDHDKWKGAVNKYKESKDLSVVKEYFKLSPANEKLLKEQAAA
jgi:hypothetical protein